MLFEQLQKFMDNTIIKYIGFLLIIGFIIYMIIRLANIQQNVVEGLTMFNNTNEDDEKTIIKINKEIDNITQQIEKNTISDDVKDTLEEYLIHADELVKLNIFNQISNNINKPNVIDNNSKVIQLLQTKNNIKQLLELFTDE